MEHCVINKSECVSHLCHWWTAQPEDKQKYLILKTRFDQEIIFMQTLFSIKSPQALTNLSNIHKIILAFMFSSHWGQTWKNWVRGDDK